MRWSHLHDPPRQTYLPNTFEVGGVKTREIKPFPAFSNFVSNFLSFSTCSTFSTYSTCSTYATCSTYSTKPSNKNK